MGTLCKMKRINKKERKKGRRKEKGRRKKKGKEGGVEGHLTRSSRATAW
jgi:hypothetical protein